MQHDWALLGRIGLGALLGFIVGWEREVRGQAAGARTFALVCSGASAFTVLGVDAFPSTAEKLIAGIVTGVGFIGAGLVLHTVEGEPRGLTTAAAVWAVSAGGVMTGGGRLFLAVSFTLLIVLALELRHVPGLSILDPRRYAGRVARDDALPGRTRRSGDRDGSKPD